MQPPRCGRKTKPSEFRLCSNLVDWLILVNVSALSNFFRRHQDATAVPAEIAGPIVCRPAGSEEIHPALRFILGSGGRAADDQQLGDFLTFAGIRNIDLGELTIAESGGAMLWAILPIHSAGRTTLLFAPNDPPNGKNTRAATMLLESICGRLSQRDVQLAQALLDPNDAQTRQLFDSSGFERMAELIYLHGAVRKAPPLGPLPDEFSMLNYSEQSHPVFAAAILDSYRESLDCPRLNGIRSIEDIIAGHKASGEFDPNHWYVLLEREPSGVTRKPRGVLILTRLARGQAAELVYLGLSPTARGRGLGDWLMRRALLTTMEMGAARLSLAVDSTNAPALKLYYRFGMSRLASKVAMMRKLA
jgi:mycothiol synthase